MEKEPKCISCGVTITEPMTITCSDCKDELDDIDYEDR